MQARDLAIKPPEPRLSEAITPYHWLVVIIASCGWLFDCMDQRLFVLARESALRELLRNDALALSQIRQHIGTATMWMILGWATGGIIFGMLCDKLGRGKTMVEIGRASCRGRE